MTEGAELSATPHVVPCAGHPPHEGARCPPQAPPALRGAGTDPTALALSSLESPHAQGPASPGSRVVRAAPCLPST